MDNETMVSVVIPSYNHKRYLLENVPKIKKFFQEQELNHEIIIVDDGSTDNTAEAVKNLDCRLLRNNINQGKGFSLKRGFLEARGSYILATDTDLAVPIDDFTKLWEQNKHDVVIGSRRVKDSIVSDVTLTRRILGAANYLLIKQLLGLPVNDTQCGFKLFDANIAKKIARKARQNGFLFDAELLVIAQSHRFSIKEVGVNWNSKPYSSIVIWRHPLEMLIELANIIFNKKKGAYRGRN